MWKNPQRTGLRDRGAGHAVLRTPAAPVPACRCQSWFEGNAAAIESTAARNSSLQGAYLIMAARSLGLDCGPMSGFDNAGVDQAFFPDGRFKSNFLINLGYGEAGKLHPRSPRFDFADACQIL
jgi:3-hydroxypropanoate dehydrogenase